MRKDLFSAQADAYSKYRPSYPSSLINWILQLVSSKNAAWDCATGNGQVASLLAEHFTKVYATDISEKQIHNAVPHAKIEYILQSRAYPFSRQ